MEKDSVWKTCNYNPLKLIKKKRETKEEEEEIMWSVTSRLGFTCCMAFHTGQQNTHIFIIISKFINVIIMSCDWASREMVKLTAGCSLYGTLMLLLHWQIFFCSSICIWIIKKNCKKFTCSCSEVNRRHQKKAVKFIWNLNLIS